MAGISYACCFFFLYEGLYFLNDGIKCFIADIISCITTFLGVSGNDETRELLNLLKFLVIIVQVLWSNSLL